MASPKLRLIWSDAAEEDLLSIWRFGADEWSATDADEHLRRIHHAAELLLDNAELGRGRKELLRGARSIIVAPHVLFYRIIPNAIEVLRVYHQREDVDANFR